jgi:glycosyltransferase involved in cell wall biosynthesis
MPMLRRFWYSLTCLSHIQLRALFKRGSEARDLAILFDTPYYIANNPDVAHSRWRALWHYLLFGAAEKRNPSPLFNTAFYLASYPDVARGGLNPLLHYVLYGARENRNPSPSFRNLPSSPVLKGVTSNPLVQLVLQRVHGRTDSRAADPPTELPATPAALQSAPPTEVRRPEAITEEAKLRFLAASRELSDAMAGSDSLVSVIIPCYNYGRFIWDAIASVLAQTYPHLEVIVIDDGSTDAETVEVLNRICLPRVLVIHQSNQGLAQTRNNGAAIASGEYLMYLDADDRLERHAVGLLLYALQHTPSAAYAYSYQRFFGDQELVWETQPFNAFDLLWANHPSVCSLIRRSAFTNAGGYRAELLYGYEDWEFWVRLSGHGHYGLCVPAAVFEHRRHGVTMTHTAHEKKRFLQRQILTINSGLYLPESIRSIKDTWRPLVSVIIPFYNRPKYLKDTLASLEAQTTKDFEIILVNDGSDEPESLELLSQLRNHDRICVLDCTNRGPAAARNIGARWARSELILFLDSDDLLDAGALEQMCWTIARYPEVAFVYSGVVHFGDIEAICYDEFDAGRLQRENYLAVTCVIRRKVFLELGGFDPALGDLHEDYDFWLRLVERGYRGKLLREPLFKYRRHGSSLSTARIRNSAGASELAESVVTRHLATRERPDRLKSALEMASDELIGRVAAAVRGMLPRSIPAERYRRPNLPNLFVPERWSGEKISILYLIPFFHVGGAEVFDLRIFSCLPRDRFRIILVACEQPEGPWYNEFKNAVDEIFCLENMGDGQEGKMAFLRHLMVAKCIDVVFNRNTCYGYELAATWPAVSNQVRYVDLLHLHAFGEDWVRASAEYHDKLDLRYVITEDLLEYAVKQYALTRERFKVLYFGMDPEEIPDETTRLGRRARIREELSFPSSAFVVGFVGRLADQKDPVRWLNVAAHIAKRRSDAVFLVVGGGEEETLERCKRAAAKLGLTGKVHFVGYQRDAAHYTAAIDVLLLTSKFEGLPLVLLEALAHGCPAVSSDVGGVRECLTPEFGELLDAKANDSAYADAVVKLAGVAGPHFAARARSHVSCKFGKSVMRRRLNEDLSSLVAHLNLEERRKDYQLSVMERAILE